jgi:hypothetical protein
MFFILSKNGLMDIRLNWRWRVMSGINKNSGYYLKKYTLLSNILKDHAHWSNECTEEKNMEAKKAIIKFYLEYRKCKPDEKYCCRIEMGHFSYLTHLLTARQALIEGFYQRVCNELYSLLYYDYFLQKRIKENVLRLIEVFLESEIAEYEKKAAKQKRGVLQWIRTNLIMCKR